MKSHFEVARECEEQSIDFVVVTIVSGRGHIPQDPGAKAIVTHEGLRAGTVGGGKVEARAINRAQELLATTGAQDPVLHVWNLQKDIGMTCGGEVTYLFELHRKAAWRVRIFGAGHVAQALARALADVPVALTCVDPRTDWIDALPRSQKDLEIVRTESPAAWLESHAGADDFFVVMTQGHASDVPILTALFKKFPQPRYVGVIGSETKGLRIKAELRERGVSEESLRGLRVPIGLPLGSNHTAEIAISIAAELLQARDLPTSTQSAKRSS